MQTRQIPQLRRKLSLLIEHGHFDSLDAIARSIGSTSKTLQSWADSGSDGQTPGLVATKAYPALINLFKQAIGKHHTTKTATALTKGRVSDLEEQLKPEPTISFGQLVDQEAKTGKASFYKRRIGSLPLVQKRTNNSPTPKAIVEPNEEFGIIFGAGCNAPHCLVLQNQHHKWGFAPAHLNPATKEIWMPDPDNDGLPDYIIESEWFGINRFIAIQSTAPFPRSIQTAIETGVSPDGHMLEELVEFYLTQLLDEKAMLAITVEILENIVTD